MMVPDKAHARYDYIPHIKTPVPYVEFVADQTVPTIVVRSDPVALEAYNKLLSKIDDLSHRLDALTTLLDERNLTPLLHPDIHAQAVTITEEEAIDQAKAIFSRAGDEAVYPSDIADELRVSYEEAVRLVEKLESDGKIRKA